jgi:hypothetical protein
MFLLFRCFLGATRRLNCWIGSVTTVNKAGWIQKECFTQRLKYFVRVVKPSKKDPIFLTVDGHYSKSRNIEVMTVLRKTGCAVFAFLRIALINCSLWEFPSCSL